MIKDLAVAVFGSSMFATHSLSGKIGNANKESQAKPPLDPTKVELIIGIKVLKVFLTLIFFYISLSDTVLKKFPATP